MKKTLQNIIRAYFSTWAIMLILGANVREPLSFVLFLLLFLFFGKTAADSAENKKEQTGRVPFTVCAGLFTLFTLLAKGSDLTASFSSRLFQTGALLVCGAGLFILWSRILLYIGCLLLKADTGRLFWREDMGKGISGFFMRRCFLFSFVILVLLWLPFYLYEYPGIFSPDGIVQMEQVLGVRALSDHHPAAHTMCMALLFRLGRQISVCFPDTDPLIFGAGFYTLIQLLFHAFCCSLCIRLIRNLRVHIGFVIGALLFFALCPYHAVFSVYAGKDTPFADITLLLLICIVHLVCPGTGFGRRKDLILFVITGIAFCLFRGNGFYAFLIFIPFLLFFFRKALLPCLPAAAIVVAGALIIKGPVYSMAGVEPGDFVESLHVPLQQVARVISQDRAVTQEETALIEKCVNHIEDIKTVYDPAFADMEKELIRVNGDQEYLAAHKADYLKLWISLGLRNPDCYLNAWTDLTKAYWYPDEEYEIALIEGVSANELGLHSFPLIGGKLVVKAREIIMKLGSFLPLYGLSFAMGTCFFLLLFALALILAIPCEKKRILVPVLPLCLFLTLFLAAPVAEFRYAYPMICALPLIAAVCVTKM